jgi:hypothetical protein
MAKGPISLSLVELGSRTMATFVDECFMCSGHEVGVALRHLTFTKVLLIPGTGTEQLQSPMFQLTDAHRI